MCECQGTKNLPKSVSLLWYFEYIIQVEYVLASLVMPEHAFNHTMTAYS
jgi:hypothetical protein